MEDRAVEGFVAVLLKTLLLFGLVVGDDRGSHGHSQSSRTLNPTFIWLEVQTSWTFYPEIDGDSKPLHVHFLTLSSGLRSLYVCNPLNARHNAFSLNPDCGAELSRLSIKAEAPRQ